MKRANLKHSIKFGDGTLENGKFKGIDTYEDWHLIPSSRPTIPPPGVETKFVTIPGLDGSVDLSQFIRKDRPAYGDRGGTFEFYVENDKEFWMTTYPKILNTLHGKRIKMVLNEDDPDYYWEGRFTVDKHEPGDGNWSTVSISFQVNPWKRKIRKAMDGTVWDNFNFEQDYDYVPWGLDNVSVSGTWSKQIWGDGYYFPLEVRGLTGSVSVTFGGKTETVAAGEQKSIGHAEYGLNTIQMTGNGTVRLNWRGGSL